MATDSISAQLVNQTVANAGPLNTMPAASTEGKAPSFTAAFEDARARQAETVEQGALSAVLKPLLSLGEHSTQLAAQAGPMLSNEFRPSELMMITMRSHQFLFHCELVANVANRASDGVQQLFRQQS